MIRYSDAYIETIARAHLQQGEQIIGRTAGVLRPWYSFGIMLFWKNYLVMATTHRLLLVEHRRGFIYDRLEAVHSIPWAAVNSAKVSGLIGKKLKLAFEHQKMTLRLPWFLPPVPKNIAGAKSVGATWEQARAIMAGQQQHALPAQGYAARAA